MLIIRFLYILIRFIVSITFLDNAGEDLVINLKKIHSLLIVEPSYFSHDISVIDYLISYLLMHGINLIKAKLQLL